MTSEKEFEAHAESVAQGHDSSKDPNTQPVQDEQWHRTSRSIVRKLDLTLMPIIWILYLFNYLDRNSIS